MEDSNDIQNATNVGNEDLSDVRKSYCSAPDDELILYRCAEVDSCDECPYRIKTDY